MKKYLFILILALSSITSMAQGIRFSVFVDPKLAWMNSDLKSVHKESSKLGVNIGLNVDKFFAKNYAIMSGISIDNTGGKLLFNEKYRIKLNGPDTTLNSGSVVNYKLQYISVPLGLKFKTNEIGYFTFFSHLGLNAGVNIKATAEVENFELRNENISDEINLFDLGYFIGAGIEYSIGGNSAIVCAITYTNGFVDITNNSNNKVTLRNFALRIGVLF